MRVEVAKFLNGPLCIWVKAAIYYRNSHLNSPSNPQPVYLQASGYYAMAGLGHAAVLARGLSAPPTTQLDVDPSAAIASASPFAGLVHTVKTMLLKTACEPHEMGRLLATAMPPPPPPPPQAAGAEPQSPQWRGGTFIEALLELLLAEAPDDIAPLMLRCAVLRDAASAQLCRALRTKQRPTTEDRLCLLWEQVRCGSDGASQTGSGPDDGAAVERTAIGGDAAGVGASEAMRDFTPGELCGVLVQHWPVMFDNGASGQQRKVSNCISNVHSNMMATLACWRLKQGVQVQFGNINVGLVCNVKFRFWFRRCQPNHNRFESI